MPAEYEIFSDFTEPLVIGQTGLDAIRQNIRVIVTTLAYSVPLDCAFAHGGEFIDSPSPVETARLVARLTEAIEHFEPRVVVDSITLETANTQNAMQGSLRPRIKFRLREGVEV